ncbi:conserved hypothetical protein [Ralstonia pseudosolanacearum GMI1000]|uniref:Chromosome partitioning protein ParB n=1 Tax=Ralstonia nicotianae (strain ATCC BAA-1114 / GMI1000) TaxID=267608 RepID=Q8XW58_RALN1|nr:conserved hypothetical protein [Ralstonia pseudosolanacearum GMI1000]
MNAVTQTEARARNAAAAIPLEAADPTKNLILVPLSRLVSRPTGRNVRKTPRMSIPNSPRAFSVSACCKTSSSLPPPMARITKWWPVAGGRRLAALKLLAKKRRISKEWEVPCLLVADGTARTASLTENVQREAMHPADQFEAFAALVAEGRPIEDIAADFSVSPLVVQRRLKLANVSPRLLADYRAKAVTLDQLMALAITDDHAAQETAFYDAPTWQRNPSQLRDRLTEREIDAYRHPLVRFVGLDTYGAAGGGVRRDLFAEGDAGVYLTDAALLERLAQDKLAGIAAEVKAEGWAWVDATHAVTHADLHAFERAPRERREPNKREAQRIKKLQTKMHELAAAVDDALDAEDEEKADALQEEGEAVSAHRTAALQIEVARHPQVALAALVHGMVQTVLQGGYHGHDLPLGVSLKVQDRLEGMAPDWPESPAAVALRELQQVAGEALPQDSAELFAALLAKSQDELVRLLAVCVAVTVDVVTPRTTRQQPGEELAQAVRLDMAAWWKPTNEGYFRQVPKAAILEAVERFAPSHVTRLAKLKKADIASEAERLADGTGWMPAIFKAEGPDATQAEPQEQDDAPEDAEATADEPAVALAA